MSDFSELCPLFNTGVFHEVTFPGPLTLSTVLPGRNLLAGTGAAAKEGYFTFGRTVVVTEAWVKKDAGTNLTSVELWLHHKLSGTAACTGTVFGTAFLLSNDGSTYEVGHTWQAFHIAAARTFTSSEVLGICVADAFTVSNAGGTFGFMVRYRDK